ncbi:uncharacterized protein LOC128928608 [Callithrix jacchus]
MPDKRVKGDKLRSLISCYVFWRLNRDLKWQAYCLLYLWDQGPGLQETCYPRHCWENFSPDRRPSLPCPSIPPGQRITPLEGVAGPSPGPTYFRNYSSVPWIRHSRLKPVAVQKCTSEQTG